VIFLRRQAAVRVCAFLLALAFPLWTCAAQNKKKPLLKPVNINTATAAELQRVPGIGPKTAEQILAMRRNVGKFRSVDDLLAVRGIGEKRLAKMKPHLTVGAAAPADAGKKRVPAASSTAAKQPAAPAVNPSAKDPNTAASKP
jgi:comEA protein